MRNRVRLVDIANETGFSVNTISLALAHSPRISQRTSEIINQVAKRLNYVPNVQARSLVKNRSNIIGVILRTLRNPVFIQMASKIEETLAKNGYQMMLMTAGEDSTKQIHSLLSHQVDGILIYPHFSETNMKVFEFLSKENYPFVLMSSDGNHPNFHAVFVDRKTGAYNATEHLITLGHKHIGFISGDRVKQEGYRMALSQYGIELHEEYIIRSENGSSIYGVTYLDGYNNAKRLMEAGKGKPTAVFAGNDVAAIGALRYFKENGISVPEKMAIVSYDNVEEAAYASVPLTTMAYSIEDETDKAVELLFKIIEHNVEPVNISIEPKIVIRQSCGADF